VAPHPAPPDAAAAPEPRGLLGSTWERWRRLLALILPGWLSKLLEDEGLLKLAAWTFAALVVLPLVLALLAAFWLVQFKRLDHPVAHSLRHWYLETINEGFSIEEMSARSHARLDYLQLFDYDLQRGKPSARRELRISLQPRQKAQLDFRRVKLVSDGPNCSVPEEPIPLVQVTLGNRPLVTLHEDNNVPVHVTGAWWHQHAAAFAADASEHSLSIELTDAVKGLRCGSVRVEGSLRVFKNLLAKDSP
jgi:hypothetical protein